jgi:putative hydrolase of HD superfamily
MDNNQDLNFLYEIGSLKNVPRGWRQHLAMDCASVAEHTMRVVWLALIIARAEGGTDENKVIRMAMAHDLVEARISDLGYVQKVYVVAKEEEANHDLFEGTSLNDFEEVVKEYEKRECLEAKIVKDADNLDIDLELKEIEECGSKLPAKLAELREKVRDEKLYTATAKKIWEQIQKSDPASWHLNNNKLIKIPEAGK